MCDMFFILKTTSFTGYADDNTPFVVRENTTNVIKALEDIGENLIKWFSYNQMKLNTEKCHDLLNSQGPNTIKIGNLCIKNSSCEKMLGINFDYKVKFTNHIDEVCMKASQKLNALARIAPYMSISKRFTLMNAIFRSQFSYCPLMWMCCNRSLNNKIDRLHGRSFQIVIALKHQVPMNYLKFAKIVKGLFQFKTKVPISHSFCKNSF